MIGVTVESVGVVQADAYGAIASILGDETIALLAMFVLLVVVPLFAVGVIVLMGGYVRHQAERELESVAAERELEAVADEGEPESIADEGESAPESIASEASAEGELDATARRERGS